MPELNLGQFRMLLRNRFLVDAKGLNKVKGQPFTIHEIVEGVRAILAGRRGGVRGEVRDGRGRDRREYRGHAGRGVSPSASVAPNVDVFHVAGGMHDSRNQKRARGWIVDHQKARDQAHAGSIVANVRAGMSDAGHGR